MDFLYAAFSFLFSKDISFIITWSFCFKIVESILFTFSKKGLSFMMVIRKVKREKN